MLSDSENEFDESVIEISDEDSSDDVGSDDVGSDDSIIELSSESDSMDSTECVNNDSGELVFLDLTHHEIVVDVEHRSPDATAKELEVIGKKFVENLEVEKRRSFSNVTIRKKRQLNSNKGNQNPVNSHGKNNVSENNALIYK